MFYFLDRATRKDSNSSREGEGTERQRAGGGEMEGGNESRQRRKEEWVSVLLSHLMLTALLRTT